MVLLVNSLDSGSLRATSTSRARSASDSVRAAWQRTHSHVLREAARFERDRRTLYAASTGGQKDPAEGQVSAESYTRLPGSSRAALHQPLRPFDVDEPGERLFYQFEENVIDYTA